MFTMMDFSLQAPLAPYGDAQAYDVQKLKTVLNHLGYYRPNPQTGLDDEIREPALFAALNAFQRDQGIEAYNHVFPRDETALALDKAARAIPKSQRYIWRTVGDGDVRGSHADREGRFFTWNDPPEGGHPGEDFNCRCWAEPVPGDANSMPSRRDGFAPPRGLSDAPGDLLTNVPVDAINAVIPEKLLLELLIARFGAKRGAEIFRRILRTKKIKSASIKIKNYLGNNYNTITNESGDNIFVSKDGNRRIRFDIKNSQGDKPHMHIERKTSSGRWRDATKHHRIKFKDD